MTLTIFFVLAAVSLISAILVISQKNSVISALYLIVTLASQAVLYFLLGATFIGVLQIIVYAGAIMVLFLFVIMLLNLKRDEFGPDRKKGQKVLGFLFSIFLAIEILAALKIGLSGSQAMGGVSARVSIGSPAEVARSLFIDYLYPFEIVSILLLVAILGVIVLVKKRY
jgi:NADH-quinone oxidoreductase subunit J